VVRQQNRFLLKRNSLRYKHKKPKIVVIERQNVQIVSLTLLIPVKEREEEAELTP
jgi:hypothetical protein